MALEVERTDRMTTEELAAELMAAPLPFSGTSIMADKVQTAALLAILSELQSLNRRLALLEERVSS